MKTLRALRVLRGGGGRRWFGKNEKVQSEGRGEQHQNGEQNKGDQHKRGRRNESEPPPQAPMVWMLIPLGAVVWSSAKDIKVLWDTYTAPYRVEDVASDISMLISKYGCAPLFMRLAWQSACLYDKETGKGRMDGCLADTSCIYSKMPCNNGLDRAVQLLAKLKEKYPITWPDLIALAGTVAIEEMGGPKITFRYGRSEERDDLELGELLKTIPDRNKSIRHLKNVFYKMGFSRSELVALMGGHTVGGSHKQFTGVEGSWTTTPFVFDNAYFIELLDNEWKYTSRSGEASCYTASGLTVFPIDLALLKDPELKEWVKIFSGNEILFHDTFAAAFQKMLELGYTDLKSSGWVNPGSSQI